MTSRFSPDQVAEIKKLRSEGWTYKQLMAKYECGMSSLHKVTGVTNPWTKKTPTTLSEEEKEQIYNYRDMGIPCTSIGKLMNVSAHTVRTVVKNKTV